eukprot:3932868-Rhodomonas_salina.1
MVSNGRGPRSNGQKRQTSVWSVRRGQRTERRRLRFSSGCGQRSKATGQRSNARAGRSQVQPPKTKQERDKGVVKSHTGQSELPAAGGDAAVFVEVEERKPDLSNGQR